jgi:hypothetical protein
MAFPLHSTRRRRFPAPKNPDLKFFFSPTKECRYFLMYFLNDFLFNIKVLVCLTRKKDK